jgi:hypothetical protein
VYLTPAGYRCRSVPFILGTCSTSTALSTFAWVSPQKNLKPIFLPECPIRTRVFPVTGSVIEGVESSTPET